MDRDENLKCVKDRREPWDIVVIGGGATGVGCALDAASRGLDVLLVEQHDFGKGTSSRSTKLIHGGVRYLRQGDISLVSEALRERAILLRNAPHVVRKQEFVIPCYGVFDKIKYRVGLGIYDLLAGQHSIGHSRMLSRSETLDRLPTVNGKGLTGGVSYFDAQFDDTRLLIDMAMTASRYGACMINYAPATAVHKREDGNFEIEIADAESGDRMVTRSRSVINAAGIFCDNVRRLIDRDAAPTTTFSQGIHIVLDRSFLPGDAAMMLPETSDGRVLFCIPWHGYTLVGTTDTPVDSAATEPTPIDAEIDFVLETAAAYLSKRPLRADILSTWAGIRPLVSSVRSENTSKLSRSHDLFIDANGLITITGGKWTTYRVMAEEAVDRAAELADLKSRTSMTRSIKIEPGSPVSDGTGECLDRPATANRSEIIHFIRSEMARTVEDVLARRTRLLFIDRKKAIANACSVAEILSIELQKDSVWQSEQVNAFVQIASGYEAREI